MTAAKGLWEKMKLGEGAPGRNRATLAAVQGGEWEVRDAGERGGGLGAVGGSGEAALLGR